MAKTKNYHFYNFFTKKAHKDKDKIKQTTISSIKLKPEFSYEDSEKN